MVVLVNPGSVDDTPPPPNHNPLPIQPSTPSSIPFAPDYSLSSISPKQNPNILTTKSPVKLILLISTGLCTNRLYKYALRLDRKSLARFKCVNRSFRSQISNPEFGIEYFSRLTPGFIQSSILCSKTLRYVPFVSDQTKTQAESTRLLHDCGVLGSDSGLVLLFLGELCVLNPITKKLRFVGKESKEFMKNIYLMCELELMSIGFSVEKIDQTTQRFGIVCITEVLRRQRRGNSYYRFEIYDSDDHSWRVTETMVSCPRRELLTCVKPVYFNRVFHWLRSDGKIVTFNPETDETRIVPTTIQSLGNCCRTWFGLVDGNLTLIRMSDGENSERVVSVYILRDGPISEWVLDKQINTIERERWVLWEIATYNGRLLVMKEKNYRTNRDQLLVYDVGANEWRFLGTASKCMDYHSVFFDFQPSWFDVKGLESFPSMANIKERGIEERIYEKKLLSLGLFMEMIDTRSGPI
ncbi:PREDICTED: F-box protein At1g20360-like [Tarenaya hassleriana]|uniref:F-box protein At1g20360-like n=1 Tax=Tarenaya hassleriana TaxID=28532 RepID=UPI00053C1C90|nr:PREDICTED: F-box protein At1g20360-like [Tarenaya hassleriana]